MKVVATVNGYAFRTNVAPACGKSLMPFSSAHGKASGLAGGDGIEVEIVPDDASREVEIPAELSASLAASGGAPDVHEFRLGAMGTSREM